MSNSEGPTFSGPLDAQQRRDVANAVPCKSCKVPAGKPCRSKSGHQMAPHKSRADDWRRKLSAREKGADKAKAEVAGPKAETKAETKADTPAGIHAARQNAQAAWAKAKAEAEIKQAEPELQLELSPDEMYALKYIGCPNCEAEPRTRCIQAMLPPGSPPVRVEWLHPQRIQEAVNDRETVRTTPCRGCNVAAGIPCVFVAAGSEMPGRPHSRRSADWWKRVTRELAVEKFRCTLCGSWPGQPCVEGSGEVKEFPHPLRYDEAVRSRAVRTDKSRAVLYVERRIADEAAMHKPVIGRLHPPGFVEAERKLRIDRARDGLWLAYRVMGKDINKFVDAVAKIIVETDADQLILGREKAEGDTE